MKHWMAYQLSRTDRSFVRSTVNCVWRISHCPEVNNCRSSFSKLPARTPRNLHLNYDLIAPRTNATPKNPSLANRTLAEVTDTPNCRFHIKSFFSDRIRVGIAMGISLQTFHPRLHHAETIITIQPLTPTTTHTKPTRSGNRGGTRSSPTPLGCP
ncbi:Putative protein of unknown function [Podospora comata]|uniref:Uncharacterized protein n=1 Tax=Podospora comata TaxID=48703 RepID=A0ABY6RV90_PODCO|nr:Putative protein of unknown function [Podospora comata]